MKTAAGFSLIELVTVLILLGILSTYAISRWSANSDLVLPAQARLLAGHLRHIQSLSSYWQQPLRVTVSSNAYWVSCITATASPPCNSSPIIDPATNQVFSVNLANGITLAGSNLDFDTLGRPVAGGTLLATAPAAGYNLSVSGGAPVSVLVAPITGFVTVNL